MGLVFQCRLSVSAGTREKGGNKLRGKSILPSIGILLKRAIIFSLLKPWRNLWFVGLWRRFPWLRAFSFAGVAAQEMLLVTLEKRQARLQTSSARG